MRTIMRKPRNSAGHPFVDAFPAAAARRTRRFSGCSIRRRLLSKQLRQRRALHPPARPPTDASRLAVKLPGAFLECAHHPLHRLGEDGFDNSRQDARAKLEIDVEVD